MQIHPIKNILVISLTSLGDVILTLPVVDALHHGCPQANITLVAGPKSAPLFRENPLITFVACNKRASLKEKIRFIRRLRETSYDLVADLRNSAIPFLVRTKFRTPIHWKRFTGVHIKDTHLLRLQTIWKEPLPKNPPKILMVPEKDREYVRNLMKDKMDGAPYVVLCPGAADPFKRWPVERFAALADWIIDEKKFRVVLSVGPDETALAQGILKMMKHPQSAMTLAGQTDFLQTVQVFLESRFVVANDSGPMHLASYLDVPTIGIFGYSDPAYARPWGRGGVAIRKNENCEACRKDAERLSAARDKRHIAKDGREHTCLQAVEVENVWRECRDRVSIHAL